MTGSSEFPVALAPLTAIEASRSAVLPGSGFLSAPWTDHTARWACRRLKSSVIVISANGEIDAANAATLNEYPLGCATRCRGLILDLQGVEYFGAAGFSALLAVSAGSRSSGIGWVVLPSAAGSRVLQICDPQGAVPTVGTVAAAVATFADLPVRRQQPPARRGPSVRCERDTCAVCGGRPRSATHTGSWPR